MIGQRLACCRRSSISDLVARGRSTFEPVVDRKAKASVRDWGDRNGLDASRIEVSQMREKVPGGLCQITARRQVQIGIRPAPKAQERFTRQGILCVQPEPGIGGVVRRKLSGRFWCSLIGHGMFKGLSQAVFDSGKGQPTRPKQCRRADNADDGRSHLPPVSGPRVRDPARSGIRE